MNTSSRITLDKIKRLVAINGGLVNFSAMIDITSTTNDPFLAAIVSQRVLDSSQPIQYQSYVNRATLSFVNDDFKHDDFQLVLESATPQEVWIQIKVVDLDDVEPQEEFYTEASPPAATPPAATPPATTQATNDSKTRTKLILLAIVITVIIGGFLVYRHFQNKKPTSRSFQSGAGYYG